MQTKTAKLRYPGIYNFTAAQKDVFFGREADVQALTTLIHTEKQVLLYAQSGVGKSSLLNAGVFPKLEEEYLILPVRFFAAQEKDSSPLEKVLHALAQYLPADSAENPTLEALELPENSLWLSLKKLALAQDKKLLLAFDQFEELFTYPEEEITTLKEELHALFYLDFPPAIGKALAALRKTQPELVTRESLKAIKSPVPVKAVYAIRTDKLAYLDRLADKLTDIRAVFHEQLPLDEEGAKEAITRPAAQEGEFEIDTFNFSKEALDKILNFLSHDKDGKQVPIESTQLQIICQRIEQEVVQKQGKKVIEKEDVPNLENIFLDFYLNAISSLSEDTQESARRLIEDELIHNGQRISLDETLCREKLEEEALQILVNQRLLRPVSNSMGRVSYELAHDSLVLPISDEASKRHEREARRKAEALAEQEREQNRQMALKMRALEREAEALAEAESAKEALLKAERKSKRMTYLAAFSALFFISLGFIYFWIDSQQEKERDIENFHLIRVKDSLEFAMQKAEFYLDKSLVKEPDTPTPLDTATQRTTQQTLNEKKLKTYDDWYTQVQSGLREIKEAPKEERQMQATFDRVHSSISFLENMNLPQKEQEVNTLKLHELKLLHREITLLYKQKGEVGQQIQQAIGLGGSYAQRILSLENLKAERLLSLNRLSENNTLLVLGTDLTPESALFEVSQAYKAIEELGGEEITVIVIQRGSNKFSTCCVSLTANKNKLSAFFSLLNESERGKRWKKNKPGIFSVEKLCPSPSVVPEKIYLECSPTY